MARMVFVITVGLLAVGLYIVTWVLHSRCSSPFPPGPIGWPVIGSLFEIPSKKYWEYYAILGKKYGMHFPSS